MTEEFYNAQKEPSYQAGNMHRKWENGKPTHTDLAKQRENLEAFSDIIDIDYYKAEDTRLKKLGY